MGGKKKKLLRVVALVVLSIPLAAAGMASEGPDTVELDSLANYYEPVTFDHAMHSEVAGSCADCHHHTTGDAPTNPTCARCHEAGSEASAIACRDCHSANPFSAENLKTIDDNPQLYHTGKPGLKGALHQKCMGCHQEMGAPTGCQDCHVRTDAGDAFFHAGPYAPAPKAEEHGTGH